MKSYRRLTFLPSYYFDFPIPRRYLNYTKGEITCLYIIFLSQFFAINEIKQMARYFALCMLITDYYDCQIWIKTTAKFTLVNVPEKKHSIAAIAGLYVSSICNNKRAFVFFDKTIGLMLCKKRFNKACCTSLLGAFLEVRVKRM